MAYSSLSNVFESFTKLKVLIIGDVMIDAYVYGGVSRISPEAPVPIVNVRSKETRLGGAANVALNVQAMGATPILCSVVGDDAEGNLFEELLEERNITSRGIIKSESRITTVKNRVLSGSQHILRIDSESDHSLDSLEQKTLIKHIENLIPECDLIIFEDYDKGTLNSNVIEATVRVANDKGIPTVVDPKRRNFMDYKNATLFKPNLKELKEGLKIEFDAKSQSALETAVARLKSVLRFEIGLITLSDRGVYIEDNDEKHHLPAHIRSIADVSGAGDTVISITGLCIALNLPLKFTAELANLGGGLVCEHLGVVPIDKDRLYNEAEKNQLQSII
ncbi:MAG: bifunctional ADP-heptose synthase [Bacteroidota bacterium]